jgi:hypothetical protein
MSTKIKKLFTLNFLWAVVRMFIAAGLMGCVSYGLVKLLDLGFEDQTLMTVLPKLVIITGVSLILYAVLSKLFRLGEVDPPLKYLKRKFFNQ